MTHLTPRATAGLRKGFSLIVLIVVGSFFAVPVHAQEVRRETLAVEDRNDFVLEPGKQELLLEPGETITKEIAITNRSRDSITFDLSVEDIAGSDQPDQTVVLLGDEIGPYSLKDFVSFPVDTVTLGFGERVRIPFTVTIPLDAEPGGKYGAIIASNAPDQIEDVVEGTATQIVSRLGSILLVRVAGDVEEMGALEEIRTIRGRRVYFASSPEGFDVLFRNSGNVHLVPYGEIAVKNLFGSTKALLPLNAYFALPQSLRYRTVAWDPGFMFGYYRAHVELHPGYGDRVDTATVSFWVLPLKEIGLGLVVILVLSALIHFVTGKFEIKRK